ALRGIHKRLNQILPVDSAPPPGLTTRPYIDIVSAYSDLENVRGCLDAYEDFKVRRMTGSGKERSGVDDVLKGNAKDLNNDDLRSRLVPRKTLSDVIHVLAMKGLRDHILEFMEREVLTIPRMVHHWTRIIEGHRSHRLESIDSIQRKMEDVEEHSEAPKKLRFGERKKMHFLSGKLAGLEKDASGGPVLKVGDEGPFKVVYMALEDAWRVGAERFDGEEEEWEIGERLMVLEEVIATLKEIEKGVAKECALKLDLNLRIPDERPTR
ncbi:hypothetical protein HDU67_005202, partial [Dinochytrium kinnereticum]